MKRTGTILFGLLFAFLAFNVAQADLNVTATSPEDSGGEIPGAAPFTIQLIWDYTQSHVDSQDVEIGGGTFGVYFSSPDGSIVNITHRDVGGLVGPFSSIEYSTLWSNAFLPGNFSDLQAPVEVDGVLPDSIYNWFITIGTGLLPNTGPQAHVLFRLQVDEGVGGTTGTLCIDSAGIGANDDQQWLMPSEIGVVSWGDPGVDGSEPICWTLTGLTPTDVTELNNDLLPTEFGLSQNYPNPFNPSTTFNFALPTKADVSIQVFNVLGQKVATLADGEYAAGVYQVTWNGTGDAGQQIASGIYFYTLKAGSYTETKKLMMLK